MKILVDDITETPVDIEFAENLPELNPPPNGRGIPQESEYHPAPPFRVRLSYLRSGDDLFFSGVIEGERVERCGRCAEDYVQPVCRPFSVVVARQRPMSRETELSVDELSLSFYSGESIDVSGLVREEVLLELPSQPRCSDSCRGLCEQCGMNLNEQSCSCRSTWKDRRLAVLSALRRPSAGQSE